MKSIIAVLACLGLLAVTPALSAAEAWTLSSLNPFAKKDDVPGSRARISDETKSSWSLPKMSAPSLPSWAKSEKSTSKRNAEPSTWEKMNNGTKQFMGKTKDTLMPWTKDEQTGSANRQTSSRSSRSRSTFNKKKTEPKKGIFGGLFQQEEEKKIETVTDFLKQPPVPY